ncbi:hypothetical protein, partial [Enterococcus faecalis]|uniref:hypothetical protein n=1 Tax=Enterococcus faecalis TaxID=1351 RepID=UPI003CC68B3D
EKAFTCVKYYSVATVGESSTDFFSYKNKNDLVSCLCVLSCVRLLSPWNFPGKNTGVHCHFPSPGDLPNSGIEPATPALAEDSLSLSHLGSPVHMQVTK